MRKAASRVEVLPSVMISSGTILLALCTFLVIFTRIAFAWATQQSVSTYCENNVIKLKATFKNTEPQGSNLGMNVVARDLQTGKSVNIGSVAPGETKEGTIDTGVSTLSNGTVRFELTWSSGKQGVDYRSASYSSKQCQSPTPSPTMQPTATPTVAPTPTVRPTASATATPAPTPAYVEPECPACPSDSQRYTFEGTLLNSSGNDVKEHSFAVSGVTELVQVVGVKMEGHPESGCRPGPGNDNGRSPCDQDQRNEGFVIYINNVAVGTVNDEGAGKDDQWFSFTINPSSPVTLSNGANVVRVQHIGGNGIGSVEYKMALCVKAKTQPTATPSPTVAPSVSPSASPTVAPTATPVATVAPTVQPTGTSAPRTDLTDGRSDGRKDSLDCVPESQSGRKSCNDAPTPVVAGVSTDRSLPTTGLEGSIWGVLSLASVAGGIYAKKLSQKVEKKVIAKYEQNRQVVYSNLR